MIIKSKGETQTKNRLLAGKIFNNIRLNPNYNHVAFKANPINHYRYQYGKSGSKATIKQINQPGGTSQLCQTCNNEICKCGINTLDASVLQTEKYDNCCPGYNEKINRVQENALGRVRNGYRKKITQSNGDIEYKYSGNNNMQKNYYADNNSYLDNKNKLFDNLSMIEKDSDGNAIVRTCNCDDLTKTNSYYMCNRKYTKFTSVTSSARTSNIRYETINKNAASLRNDFGSNMANAAGYSSRTEVPHIIKINKPGPCDKTANNKHKQYCFHVKK